MAIFRLLRTALVVAFVALMFITRISQSFDYWWIAVIVTILAIAPDALELWRGKKQPGDPKRRPRA